MLLLEFSVFDDVASLKLTVPRLPVSVTDTGLSTCFDMIDRLLLLLLKFTVPRLPVSAMETGLSMCCWLYRTDRLLLLLSLLFVVSAFTTLSWIA